MRHAIGSFRVVGYDPPMTAEASQVRIRPGTLDDNRACSSEPFGRFEQYLFCAPALIL